MTTKTRLLTGFPVEVALHSDLRHVQSRQPGIHSFTCAPEPDEDGIWCDSEGARPGSIAWGLTLDPVTLDGAPDDVQASCLYVETTKEELERLMGALAVLYNENFGHTCRLMGGHTTHADCVGCHNDPECAKLIEGEA